MESTDDDANQKQLIQEFFAWLEEKNIESLPPKKVGIGAFDDTGRGVIALEDIEAEETIIEVPERLIMSSHTVKHTAVASILEGSTDGILVLIVMLMYETNNPSSFWAPYLKLIPSEYDSPLFWTDEELSLLEGTKLENHVPELKNTLKGQYDQMKSLVFEKDAKLFPMDVFTYDRFIWAMATIWSRAFWMDNTKTVPGLVPMADMMNHPTFMKSNNNWADYFFDEKSRSFKMIVHTEYKKGDQVWTLYGLKNDADFLMQYGMILLDNPNNSITYQLTDPFLEQVPHFKEREEFLDKMKIASKKFEIPKGRPPYELMSALRVYCMLEEETDLSTVFEHSMYISVENEYNVVSLLIELMVDEVYRRGTIEEDNRLLDSETLSHNGELAVWFRKGEKKDLLRLLVTLRNVLEYLEEEVLTKEEFSVQDLKWIEEHWGDFSKTKQ